MEPLPERNPSEIWSNSQDVLRARWLLSVCVRSFGWNRHFTVFCDFTDMSTCMFLRGSMSEPISTKSSHSLSFLLSFMKNCSRVRNIAYEEAPHHLPFLLTLLKRSSDSPSSYEYLLPETASNNPKTLRGHHQKLVAGCQNGVGDVGEGCSKRLAHCQKWFTYYIKWPAVTKTNLAYGQKWLELS